MKSLTKRRGITPVISIVLLLGITVSAVGVLYGQIGEIGIDDDALAFLEIGEDTSINIRSAYSSDPSGDGQIMLTLVNDGERAIDFNSELDVYIDQVDYQTYASLNDDFNEEDMECLDLQLDVGESTSDVLDESGCNTGIDFPGAFDDPVQIEFDYVGSHLSWGYTCSVRSTQDAVC